MGTAMKRYDIEGTFLEACSCAGPCPCWVGDDPDGGSCDAVNAYHVDRGQINGVDVSGLSLIKVVQIPGNVLDGNWREVLYVDDKATPKQREALLTAFSGRLGGPLADLAALIGDQVAVYDAPIEHKIEGGSGTLYVGEGIMAGSEPYPEREAPEAAAGADPPAIIARIEPYRDREGRPTTLQNSLFSSIPGSAAVVGKAPVHKVNVPEHQMVWEFSDRNAIQGPFHFEA
ncbi:DUF1326 domain-containing protein [Nitrolancea hollandica]|uniref:DUF1326 domain-containing protein n=1 Tax=Nitrolancea hollandica Lb TaxID=1129897 RepID=I4EKB9_9BACT|nr:DUF1326 domain-containing protein [Nitrolancea hollandica]CCF85131.1 conserved hypothetical protein [Nitrolancea hollandica Lb]